MSDNNNCLSCKYWGGNSRAFNADFTVYIKAKGKCHCQGSNNPRYYNNDVLSAYDTCQLWEKHPLWESKSEEGLQAEEYIEKDINSLSSGSKKSSGNFLNIQRIILFVCTAIGLVVSIIGSVMSDDFMYIWFGIGCGVMLSYLITRILKEGFSGIIEEGWVGFLLWLIIFGAAGPIGFFIRLRQTRD